MLLTSQPRTNHSKTLFQVIKQTVRN